MSAPPSIDAYDAQMLDFSSDPDITMNITGSSEFLSEALMDHEVSAYGVHASVEVDMEEYVGENAEYEMADETAEYHRPIGDELLDIEVYDASHAPSPFVPPQPLQPSTDVPVDSRHPAPTSPAFSDHATPNLHGEAEPEVHPLPLDHPVGDVAHTNTLTPGEGVPSEAVLELVHPTETEAAHESMLPISESHEQLGDAARSVGQPFETPAPAGAVDDAESHVPPVAEAHVADSEVAQHKTPEPPTAESTTLANAEEAYDSGLSFQDENAADQTSLTEGEAIDPLHVSDGVYTDSPPAVLLSISDSSPGFVLFSQHDPEGEAAGESHGHQEAFSLLLDNRPTLYYEPLSSVFEALRQDEALLSRVPHSFEGELVLDAYDLQLAVSEDNVHSREISLHDLNILHDGSDFVGPLRLSLRAIVPRFILRYYALQEQIRRLNVVAETVEGEHDEEHEEQYDTGEEQRLPQEVEAATHPSKDAVVASGEEPPVTEAEEPSGPPEQIEETPQEQYEPGDSVGVQDPVAEYHEVTGESSHALGDEDDYEGTNAGDEDEAANTERLDADQVHDTAAEDADAPTTVSGQGSEFGGEHPEYLDFVQPEEYDDRYGEDLPERASGASPVQYGQHPYYEEEGEQEASTAVDETEVPLPDLNENEEAEDSSATTPVPARIVLESELSEPTDDNTTDLSGFPKLENLTPNGEELPTSEPANEAVDEQTSSIQLTNTAHAEAISEVDESDSNFVSMLEREADAEPERTFSTEQNKQEGQEGSIEAALQHESIWDEWDDEDAEGEDEEDWMDPDAASNESSVTLDSKASSKRSYDEVDPSEEVCVEDPHASPGSKRPRVQ